MSGETNQGSLKGHIGPHREATVKPTGTRSQMASNQAGALITQVLLKITQRVSDWNGSRFLSCRMSLCWTATSNAKEEYLIYGHQTHTSGRKSPPPPHTILRHCWEGDSPKQGGCPRKSRVQCPRNRKMKKHPQCRENPVRGRWQV